MQPVGVIQGRDIFPVLPTITGMHDDAVSPHGPPFPCIAEPQVQERARRSRSTASFGVVEGEMGVIQCGKYGLIIRRDDAGAL
ncbi:hypothetical protein D3C84_1058930 [compost metagenome]